MATKPAWFAALIYRFPAFHCFLNKLPVGLDMLPECRIQGTPGFLYLASVGVRPMI